MIKRLIKKTTLYRLLRNSLQKKIQEREMKRWEREGRFGPTPHIIKQNVLMEYSGKYGLNVFVETGTYFGDMVEAMKDCFGRIYSIELDQHLFREAKKRFVSAKHIEIIHADSGGELGKVIKKINQPILFWLDGHYSGEDTARGKGDTPIYNELNHILSSKESRHVIIIDDAHCFGMEPSYPTIKELEEFINSKRDYFQVTVLDNIIRVVPRLKGTDAPSHTLSEEAKS